MIRVLAGIWAAISLLGIAMTFAPNIQEANYLEIDKLTAN